MPALFTTGGYEWIIILFVALLLFGRRLPEMMRSVGQGVRQFKKGLQDVDDKVETAGENADTKELPRGSDSDSTPPAG